MADMSAHPCTVCGAVVGYKVVLTKMSDERGDGSISLYQCGSCETVYLSEYKSAFDDDLYAYYRKYQGMRKEDLYDRLTRKSYSSVLKLLSSYGDTVSILDVGCGKGDFVDAALDGGYNAEGIELAQLAVDIARRHGLPVTNRDFFASVIQESSKDAVTMFEVIEHVPDPIAFLRRAEAVVRPGGLIYMTTPNFNSLDRRILGSQWDAIHREHLSYFTPSTLLHAIRKHTNLELLHLRTRNISAALINRIGFWGLAETADDRVAPVQSHDFRARLDKSSWLMLVKRSVNAFLNATSLGSTIIVVLRRPE